MRRGIAVLSAAAVLSAIPVGLARGDETSSCPAAVDAASFATADELRAGTQVMADLGARPTASPAHTAFVDWVEDRLDAIDGLALSDRPVTIDRQLETGASLRVGPNRTALPVAGAVPYAAPGQVTAPLLVVPAGTALSAADIAGRIVVRPLAATSVAYAVFAAVSWFVWDPDVSLDLTGAYERDWLNAVARITDLADAEAGGAAGLVFVHDLPRAQIAGQYAPYPGRHWKVPAVFVGADEGQVLLGTASTGASATLRVRAERAKASTRTLIASLPGLSAERIVIESHTDGMNAVWDNGPIALLAMAEHFAGLPLACRPRTIEFVFTTGHLYLSQSGVHDYAAVLDDAYDDGTVALVVALEHLGAREWAAAPRTDGGAGRQLVRTGADEMFAVFVPESPALVTTVVNRVVGHDLRRTLVLRGADAPQAGFPPHRSFGGEGGPYRERIVPTIAAITGPWTLFDPAFDLDELVDPALMRRQTLAFTDIIHDVEHLPRTVIAGADTAYRLGRDVTEAADNAVNGLLPPGTTLPGAPTTPTIPPLPLALAEPRVAMVSPAAGGYYCTLGGLSTLSAASTPSR
jgi:hypothetical protein